ncbi:MAG: CvpA family protein [Firmicutes bacterium]|nr:CvpA family protein [Bacillota bacterium]
MKNKILPTAVKTLISAAIIFLMFWFELPAVNLRSEGFWSFLVRSIIVCIVVYAFGRILAIAKDIKSARGYQKGSIKELLRSLGKPVMVTLAVVAVMIAASAVFSIVGSQLFNASGYNKLLVLEDGDFSADVAELNMTQIPVVDRDTAVRLGARKMGNMEDLVSQFDISEEYTQINYKGRPTRVTPLCYGDPIKWFNNQSQGLPAYIMVDMVTQETTLVRLDEGMKYSSGEYFMRNIYRYLRFKYPTKIFDNITFEIDENGTPYWVASTVSYRIGFWSGRDIGGAVLVNAVTGESSFYKLNDVPTWVDQVYSSDMIIEQLIYNGKYRSGFFNSIFGQKGVLQPTDGYNYLAIDDDVWLYTGITSVMSDESNVGFVLVNLRTKDARYYSLPGAEEYSAMSSAEGQVQNLGYKSTFPILLNVGDRPTYFMSLKDDAGLVKMYAFVDVEQYQIVGTGSSPNEARTNYIAKLGKVDTSSESETPTEKSVSGKISGIESAVVSGNTKYYFMLQGDSSIYIADISQNSMLPFMGAGAEVELTYTGNETRTVTSIKLAK